MNEVLILCSSVAFEQKVILFLVLLASISIHEWAHAFAADKLGDPLPERKEGSLLILELTLIRSEPFSYL